MTTAKKWLLGLLALIFVGVCLLFPADLVSLTHRLAAPAHLFVRFIIYVLPYTLYFSLGAYLHFGKRRLFEILRDAEQMELEKQQMASLTLAGFCFTSLGLLISFYKEEIKRRDPGPHAILIFFAVALGCFMCSHMVLRFRGKRFYALLSDASIDNGLWCILAGLWFFCSKTSGLESLSIAFGFAIVVYIVCVGLNCYYYVSTLR
jgi:hypothetical protein